MHRSFVYLCASWIERVVGCCMAAVQCSEVIQEALARPATARPSSTPTKGGQFCHQPDVRGLLKGHGIQIGTDDIGCWLGYVFVERLYDTAYCRVASTP